MNPRSGSIAAFPRASSRRASSAVKSPAKIVRLGKTVNSLKDDAAKGRSIALWESKFSAAKLLYSSENPKLSTLGKNISHCGRVRFQSHVDLTLDSSTDRASLLGLKRCKSVHACPTCARSISAKRKTELDTLFQASRAAGCSVWLLTLTFSHKRGDVLASILDQFKAAQARFRQLTGWRNLKSSIVGTCGNVELTWSPANAWHPHAHWVVISHDAPDVAFAKIDALRADWLAALQSAGLRGGKAAWLLQDGSAAQRYVAKFGPSEAMRLTDGTAKEIALSSSKSGRSGSRTAFQILDDYRDGCQQSGALFLEYAAAMFGRRALIWSNGLKEWAGVDQVSDADAAASDDVLPGAPSAVILRQWFDLDHWRNAARRRVSIVHAAETGGSLDLAEFGPTDREQANWRRSESDVLDPE